MTKMLSIQDAQDHGYVIVHESDAHRFTLYDSANKKVGEAHYTLLDDDAVDFDHTKVDPSLRGTGLGALLAQAALGSDLAKTRKIHTSCSFIAKHHGTGTGGACKI